MTPIVRSSVFRPQVFVGERQRTSLGLPCTLSDKQQKMLKFKIDFENVISFVSRFGGLEFVRQTKMPAILKCKKKQSLTLKVLVYCKASDCVFV